MTTYDPYDPKLRELVEKKTKIRMALRQEFIKQVYNPHRHATGEGGILFDPAHQRLQTMHNQRHFFFKPTPRTSVLGLLLVFLPIGGLTTYAVHWKNKEELKLRTGQVAYADRFGKFV